MNVLDQPVAKLAARVRSQSDALTARAVVDACLARIEHLDASVRAFLTVTNDLARAQADAVDALVANGKDPGPLAGVPLAVKDNLAVPDVAMTCASKILTGYVPPHYATSVQRAVNAGACVVGKTNLDEFAMGSSTENSAFGPSRNPYDITRVPGGSSGGSAAAVAAGMAPLALGSDTGGSIRQPAALCGIVGHKPSYGRVSRNGLTAFGSSLDQVGPFGRCVADAALLQSVIEGADPLDATSASQPPVPHPLPPPTGAVRVGRVAEFTQGLEHTPAVAAVERAREAMHGHGLEVVDVSLPLVADGIPIYYLVAPAEASSNLARFDGIRYGMRAPSDTLRETYARTRNEGFGAEVKRRILLGTFALSSGYADAYYKRAMAARATLRAAFHDVFTQCDVLVSATTPTAAFPIGEKVDDPLAMYRCDLFTVAANLAGVPAVSIPCGRDTDGLPLGLQVWGPVGQDALVLQVAAAFEHHLEACRYEAPVLAQGADRGAP